MEEKEEDEETTSSSNNEDEIENEHEEEAWGTLEELLLVCAVNRHGTKSWDSIAKELQKRTKHSSFNNNDNNNNNKGEGEGEEGEACFSSRKCEKKYVDLKRRFNDDDDDEEDDGDDEEYLLRMVDELRKLRVEELKREVHRHDVSIVSLQLKVKRLEEEREKSKVKEDEEEVVLSDLRNKPEENAMRTGEKTDELERSSPEKVVTGDSVAENRSCNESNSTNHHQKVDNNNIKATVTEERESKLKREPDEPDPVRQDNNKKRSEPVGEGKTIVVSRLGESLSESRRESTKQQSSDVQSSASLSKKIRRRFRGDSGDELEVEELSLSANKRINAKSQPLIRFLDNLRSHKHGSVFQRRLPGQETEKYRHMVRQHMDLDTVQSRLDKGIYCDCHYKFYRDLLLIFTNAVLFYRKSSAEHLAAKELRKFVMDEITQKTRKPKIQPRKPDLEPQHLEPVVKKPRSSTTMVVCRRRSSMQALSDSIKKVDSTTSTTTNTKNHISSKVENGREEKIKPNHLQKKVDSNNNSGSLSSKKEKESDKGGGGGGGGGDANGNLKKLLARERLNLGNGGLRLSNNNGKKIISKDGNKREKIGNISKDDKDENSEGEGAQLVEKRKINNGDKKQEKGTPIVLKKQGVANFLKRMKQNSPSNQEKAKNNDSDEEDVDVDVDEEKKGRKDKIQSTNTNGKKSGGNVKKNVKEVEMSTRRSSSRRGERETATSRRGIGRPPKRKAAMMSSTPDSAKGGRSGGRDGGDKVKKKPRR